MADQDFSAFTFDAEWYKDIVKGTPDSIIIIDRNYRTIFRVNPDETEDINSDEYYLNKSIFEFIMPEFHHVVREKFDRVFEEGRIETYELASDLQPPGLTWYMTRLGPITRDGVVVAVLLFIREITELKEIQQNLSRMNEELELRVEERTRVLNDYAHRLEVSEKLNIKLRRAENRQEVLGNLVEHSMNILEGDVAGIYQLNNDALCLAISLQQGDSPPYILDAEHDRFLYRLLRVNQTHYVLMTDHIELECQFCSFVYSQNIQSLMVAPLQVGDIIAGVLYVGWKKPRHNVLDDEQLLNAFVESGSNTLHRIRVAEQLELNVRQREHELRILYDIMSTVSAEVDVDVLLKKALDITLQVVHCEMGAIHLFSVEEQKLKLAIRENIPDKLYNLFVLSEMHHDMWRHVYQTQKPVQITRLPVESKHESASSQMSFLCYSGVPIHAKENVIGVLSIFCENEDIFNPGVNQLVSTIADQIGLGIENSSQRQRDKEAFLLEERQRLARELHDSISQSLYGLVLSADVSAKLLKIKAYANLEGTLDNIGNVAHQALKEMRLMLFELRPLSFETVGLPGALELRLNTVERRAGIETILEINGDGEIPKGLDMEVYRVATEALNNCLKHAQADKVSVELSIHPGSIDLKISDNGKGFDKKKTKTGGIGLSSMKERTKGLNGKIAIVSSPGAGTEVLLTVPFSGKNTKKQVFQ